MDENLQDEIQCPICMEIPPGEIYQCSNGHIVCKTCSADLKECPQCRTKYGTTKIRSRVLEGVLDRMVFDCANKFMGCTVKTKRQNISDHAKNCTGNRQNAYSRNNQALVQPRPSAPPLERPTETLNKPSITENRSKPSTTQSRSKSSSTETPSKSSSTETCSKPSPTSIRCYYCEKDLFNDSKRNYRCLHCPQIYLCHQCMETGKHGKHLVALIQNEKQKVLLQDFLRHSSGVRPFFHRFLTADDITKMKAKKSILSEESVKCCYCKIGKPKYICLQCGPSSGYCWKCFRSSKFLHPKDHCYALVKSREQLEFLFAHLIDIGML